MEAAVERVFSVLNREVELDALDSLVFSLPPSYPQVPLDKTAIAIDANVLLRLNVSARGADVVDFLSTTHKGPLVLPGQVIQEFWNNQFLAVDSLSAGMRKKFDGLKSDVQKVDASFGGYGARFDQLLDEFGGEFGYLYDEGTTRRVIALFSALKQKAIVPYAPRSYFSEMAASRKRTKTPPGFKDDGDGDFFVWVDLLLGLQRLRENGSSFERVILVSNDRKLDWSREGTPHPILLAEMKVLTGASLEMFTGDELAKELLDSPAVLESAAAT